MGDITLSDGLFARLAGWEAVKEARGIVAVGRVLSAAWEPPNLRGEVQWGGNVYRAGLIIKSPTDAENVCTCRPSRQWGMICAHSVAIGLHLLKREATAQQPISPQPGFTPSKAAGPEPAARPRTGLRRATRLDEGEPLRLHLILPPNLAETLERGKIMLCWEAETEDRRVPLGSLPRDVAFRLSAPDASLLEAVETLNHGEAPTMMMLDADRFASLLPRLVGHPGVTLGKSRSLEISETPWEVPVQFTLSDTAEIVIKPLANRPSGLLAAEVPWVFRNDALCPLGLPKGGASIWEKPRVIARAQIPQFLHFEWPEWIAQAQVQADFVPEDFTMEVAAPHFRLHLTGGLAMLAARLACDYGERRVIPGVQAKEDALWLADPQAVTHYVTRNIAAESAALERLTQYGFQGPDAKGLYHLNDRERVLKFFASEYPRLEREWEVTLEPRLEQSTQEKLERIQPQFRVIPSGEQWFDLHLDYESGGGERFSAADIQRLLLSGQNHTPLRNGKTAVIDTGAIEELQEVLRDCAPQQHANGYRLHAAQSGFLEGTLRQQPGWKLQAPNAWKERAGVGAVNLQPPELGPFKSILRSYQAEGVGWFRFLRRHGFGGVLADEMGLGKTLQVLATLGTLDRASRSGPWLVICPTSLVFNWVDEAKKFAPKLQVLALHGSGRVAQFSKIPEADLVVTSYAVCRRDLKRYAPFEFDTVVLDEAQHIKNRQTQNAKAVKQIQARHRLVLTGTPLENSVADLWSIFDFLMPGYLGSAGDFQERYETPIVRNRSSVVQQRLSRRLQPFIRRRLKKEVAAELPDRIEQVCYCELAQEQKELYQQILEAGRRQVLNLNATPGSGKGRMQVLTALLRLRQVCCDPRLLAPKLDNPAIVASGKVELFNELLEEIIDGDHRVLVFSQFTQMLSLLRAQLEKEALDFCYLDGSTRNRAEVVGRFQRDPKVRLFLISLKAGGLGLNLTAADTVIHFDPWWNPAVEAQATDRAHRIGQHRVVTSYKLITRGTVEEKILNLQTRKKALTQAMLGGEDSFGNALTWEEIRDLFGA